MNPSNGKPRSSILDSGADLLRKIVYENEQEIDPRNQRREDRQPVAGEVIVVEVNAEGERQKSQRVFIRDLSKSGCGLWSRARIEPGSSIVLMFQGPDGQPIHRMSTVCHCRGRDGTGFAIGVRFVRDVPPGSTR